MASNFTKKDKKVANKTKAAKTEQAILVYN